MEINLVSKNIELTQEVKDYVLKKVTNLGKLLKKIEEKGGEIKVNFEVSRSTNHHKTGDVFHCDCTIVVDGEKFYLGTDENDVYKAIDKVKNDMFRQIRRTKNKKETLFRRGAKSVKKMFKGHSNRNPETGKY